jgi:hypothetical protein
MMENMYNEKQQEIYITLLSPQSIPSLPHTPSSVSCVYTSCIVFFLPTIFFLSDFLPALSLFLVSYSALPEYFLQGHPTDFLLNYSSDILIGTLFFPVFKSLQ